MFIPSIHDLIWGFSSFPVFSTPRLARKDLLPYDYKVQVLPASLDTHDKLLICFDGCIWIVGHPDHL